MAESSLAKKLLLKPGQRVVILNAPAGYLDQLGSLPEGASLVEPGAGTADVVHLFVKNRDELAHLWPVARQAARRDAVLWLSYPKRSAKVKTDITRDVGWESVTADGYEGVALVAVDEVWSAMRFRPAQNVRSREP